MVRCGIFLNKFIHESENLDSTIIKPSMSIERSWASQKLLFCVYTLAPVLSLVFFFSVNCFPFLLFLFPPSSFFSLSFSLSSCFSFSYLPPSLLSVPVFLCLLPFFVFLSFLFFSLVLPASQSIPVILKPTFGFLPHSLHIYFLISFPHHQFTL